MRLNRLILKIFSYFFRAANPYSYVQRSHRLPCSVPTSPRILSDVIHTGPIFPQNFTKQSFRANVHISDLVSVQHSHMSETNRAVAPYTTSLTCNVPTYQFWSFFAPCSVPICDRAAYPHTKTQFMHRKCG